MKAPDTQADINAARKRRAVRQVFDNLVDDLNIAQGRLKRSQKARERGDSVLGANVEGLQAEAARLTKEIAAYGALHNLTV